MIEVEETGSGLHAWDSSNNELFIGTSGWRPTDDITRVDRADLTIGGYVDKLVFPADVFSIKDNQSGKWETYGSRSGNISLDNGDYLVQIHSSIISYIVFDRPAKIQVKGNHNQLSINFQSQSEIGIGFRTRFRMPSSTLEIPESPEGLAYAITQTSKCFDTKSPDRSYPSLRNHPPRFDLQRNHTGPLTKSTDHLNSIVVEAPGSYEELFVISPLVHYLQADLHLKDRENVKISLPTENYSTELTAQPSLEKESNRMLRQVFLLDCLVRDFGEYKINLENRDLLNKIGLNGKILYDMDPEPRLVEYLNCDFEDIQNELPNWHLIMHLDPTPSSIETLPFLLNTLCSIYTPKTEIITDQELLETSLIDSMRLSGPLDQNNHRRIQQPIMADADNHGWLSDDIPLDAFKVSMESFEHRLAQHKSSSRDSKSIVVILNEHEMKEEFERIYEIFTDDLDYSTIDLRILNNLSRRSLKELITGPSIDFLHYIGHCDDEGVRCSDGNFSFSNIEYNNIQTFFLNACGSFKEGLNLIERGSVVGAVTLEPVLDEAATKVGTTFARLVINGFSFSRGLELARRQIIMHKFYSVVGDGTHRLTNGSDPFPILLEIDRVDENEFKVTSSLRSAQIIGASFQPKIPGKNTFQLVGSDTVDYLDINQLGAFLSQSTSPVIMNGELIWPENVLEEFDENVAI